MVSFVLNVGFALNLKENWRRQELLIWVYLFK